MNQLAIDTPVGRLAILRGDDGQLLRIDFDNSRGENSTPDELEGSPAAVQLKEYFAGQRSEFSIGYEFTGGTEFQRLVWRQIATIPYGETVTYGDIARALGRPGASRAVGAACGQNPISIVVPCHRVVGAHNKLTGYGGGLDRKVWLLAFEGGRPFL